MLQSTYIKHFITILLFSLYCLKISAQPPARFYTTFGGNGVDVGYSAKQTLDKHYIVAGSTSSYGAGNSDVYLVKLDSMGQILWSKTFGGFLNDVGKSVIQLADSGYVVAGFTSSYGAGGYDAYIIRTDKLGTLIWQRTFGGTDWDFANDLVYTPDGDIMVVGNTSSFGSGKKDGFVVKYDFLGNIVFQKYYGGAEDDELKSIIRTNDNFIATVGYTKSKGEINGDCYFLKLDLNGDTLFTKTFGGAFKDYANDLVQKPSNDYVIAAAKTFSSGVNAEDYMYSFSSTGSFIWDNHYLSNVTNGGFVSVANSNQIPSYSAFLRTMIYFGNEQAENFVAKIGGWGYLINASGGGGKETCYSIEDTKDGGYVTVGTTESFGAVNGDVYFIKQDSTIINYSSIVGLKENQTSKAPIIFANNNTLFISEVKEAEQVKITDLTGRLLFEKQITSESEKVDITELPASIYIVEIRFRNGKQYCTKVIKSNSDQ